MGYPILTDVLDKFVNHARQYIKIDVYPTTGDDFTITQDDIPSGGLKINRYSVSGSTIEIGSAIAAELDLTLYNTNGEFNDVVFEGAELYVRVGVYDSNDLLQYIPMGYFTVDECPRKLSRISLTALDRMVQFDVPAPAVIFTPNMTVQALVNACCSNCNVTLDTTLSTLPNYNYTITAAPNTNDLTYRQLIQWCAEIMGVCAFIDWQGHLVFKWYTAASPATTLTTHNRKESDLQEQPITITGVQVVDNGTAYLAGQDGYVLNIEGNALIQHDYASVAQGLVGLINFAYTAFSATILPMPQLYPLDIITFKDASGTSHTVIVTDVTFVANQDYPIAGKGETAQNKGYAAANPLTNRESVLINNLINGDGSMNDRIQSALDLNKLVANALGIFMTGVVQPNNSVIYYLHDQSTLENSMNIFTMTSNGIAWTSDGWNGGQPTWQSGVTAAGDALFRFIYAQGINVAAENNPYTLEMSPSTFMIKYNDNGTEVVVMQIESDKMTIPRVKIDKPTGTTENDPDIYLEIGNVRLAPYLVNGQNAGMSIFYME